MTFCKKVVNSLQQFTTAAIHPESNGTLHFKKCCVRSFSVCDLEISNLTVILTVT